MGNDGCRQILRRFFFSSRRRHTRWNCDWSSDRVLFRSSLHEFGTTRDGTRVTANKLLTQFDFVCGIGSIVPHRVKGLSGGAKIAFPGVAGKEMMDRNQDRKSGG